MSTTSEQQSIPVLNVARHTAQAFSPPTHRSKPTPSSLSSPRNSLLQQDKELVFNTHEHDKGATYLVYLLLTMPALPPPTNRLVIAEQQHAKQPESTIDQEHGQTANKMSSSPPRNVALPHRLARLRPSLQSSTSSTLWHLASSSHQQQQLQHHSLHHTNKHINMHSG